MVSNSTKVTLDVAVQTQQEQIDELEARMRQLQQEKLQVKIETQSEELTRVTQEIEDTKNELNRLQGKVEIDNSEIESLESELNETLDVLDSIEGVVGIDDSQVEEVRNHADELQSQIEELQSSVSVDTTEIDGLESQLSNLESTQLELELSVNTAELDNAKSQMDDLKNSTDSAAQSTSSLDSALGAVAGAAAAAGLMEMVDTAGNISDSWNRLELTFGGVSESMKQSINSAAAETGRSGGAIRSYFNQMGIAGVTNTDLLSQSFQSLSGRAYQTGASIDTLQNVMQRMVLSGNVGARQLTQLGISTEDLGRAMGVTGDEASKAFEALSQEDRLRVLTQAMGDGKAANEDYKNSWQGVKDQASAAMAGLIGAVGTPILQMLIPAMQTATRVVKMLSDGFKSLPQPLQAVIGGIGASIGVVTAFAGTIGVVGKVIGGLKDGIEVIRGLSSVSNLLTRIPGILSSVAGGFSSLFSILLANPIILVVVAVVALIAALVYLYYTNEDFRNSVNAVGEALWGLGEIIYGTLVGALEWLQGAWQNTVDWFSNGAQTISDTVTGAFTWLAESATGSLEWLSGAWQNTVNWFTSGAQWISDSVTGAFSWLLDIWNQVVNAFNTYAPLVAQVLFVMATGGVGAIVLLIMNFMGMPTQVGTALQNVINRVLGFVSSLVSNFTNGARQSVSNFMNQIRSLPGKFLAELNRMLSYVNDWAATLPAKFWEAGVNAVKNFLNALGIHSPGFMAVNFSEEIKRLEDSATYNAIADRISGTAKDIVHAWGSPELEYQVNQLLDKESQNTKNDNNSLIELLRIIIDILRNLPKPEGGSFTFNHYGDTDSEERMERILEAVRRDFYWNNEKAGRNVEELYGV